MWKNALVELRSKHYEKVDDEHLAGIREVKEVLPWVWFRSWNFEDEVMLARGRLNLLAFGGKNK